MSTPPEIPEDLGQGHDGYTCESGDWHCYGDCLACAFEEGYLVGYARGQADLKKELYEEARGQD